MDDVDLPHALATLRNEFGIERLLLEGGGGINGAFLAARLIDEVSLLLMPVADGAEDTPTLFDRIGGSVRTLKLSPDPNGGRYLWASTQTALAADWLSKRDADGQLPGEYWPRVYSATTSETPDAETPVISASYQVENSMVAGARLQRCLLRLPRRRTW